MFRRNILRVPAAFVLDTRLTSTYKTSLRKNATRIKGRRLGSRDSHFNFILTDACRAVLAFVSSGGNIFFIIIPLTRITIIVTGFYKNFHIFRDSNKMDFICYKGSQLLV